jgi:hypothetical protein
MASTRTLALILIASFSLIAATADCARARIEPEATGFTFGAPVNNLALSVKLDQQVVAVDAPITATFALKNFGAPILVYRVGSLMEYGLIGTGPDGSPIAKTHEVPFSGSVPSGTNIGTGEALENTSDLSKYYNFQKPGRYTFWFQTAVNLQHHLTEVYANLRSNTLTLDVK